MRMSGECWLVWGGIRPLILAWPGHVHMSLFLVDLLSVLFIFLIHKTGDIFYVATWSL